MKQIRLDPNIPSEVRGIGKAQAMDILDALHRYAAQREGDIKPLQGEFAGMLRLRVSSYRVVFTETSDSITVHRIRHRKDAYR